MTVTAAERSIVLTRETPRARLTDDVRSVVRCAHTGFHVAVSSLLDSANHDRWRDLASRAAVQNIFYEPEYAVPATLPFGSDIKLLTVSTGRSPNDRMLAAWPVRVSSKRWGVPLGVLAGWSHPFAHLGVPLLDRDEALGALVALLNAPEVIPSLPGRLLLPNVHEDGPFGELLRAAMQRLNLISATYEPHIRAKMCPATAGDYFGHLSASTRSKLRQQARRIEKQGITRFETISEPEEIEPAIDDYIALESHGWKARAGTAISCSPTESDFLRQMARNLAAARRIRVHRLRLNETTIAASITYYSPAMAWYAKISFDESQEKNSPGSQLVTYATEEFLRDPAVEWADSCAPPGHPLMRRFWSEDLRIATLLLGKPGPSFFLATRLERARGRASAAWNHYKDWKRGSL